MKVVATCNELIVDEILGKAIGEIITVRETLRYSEGRNFLDDLDIPSVEYVKILIADTPSGGSSNVLEFTLTTDSSGDIDLSGQTGMPAAGTLASAKAAYDGDTDYSQSLTYNPTTQVLSTGVNSTELRILMTFGTPIEANDPPTNGIVDDENRTFTFTEPI